MKCVRQYYLPVIIHIDDDTYTLLGLDIIGQQQGSTWSYFGYDGLGSVRQVYDSLGAVTYATSYAPYGDPFEQYGDLTTTLGFTGEYTDPTGLLYLRARYLNTDLGTFLSRDPFEGVMDLVMSRNGYLYVHGNPVMYIDPSGMILPIIGVVISCIIMAIITAMTYDIMVNQGKSPAYCDYDSWDDFVDSVDWGRAAFFGLAAAPVGAAIGAVPAQAIIGGITAVAAGVLSGSYAGENRAQRAGVDMYIGIIFAGIGGVFLKAEEYYANASVGAGGGPGISFPHRVSQALQRALGMGGIFSVQGVTNRAAYNVVLGEKNDIYENVVNDFVIAGGGQFFLDRIMLSLKGQGIHLTNVKADNAELSYIAKRMDVNAIMIITSSNLTSALGEVFLEPKWEEAQRRARGY